MSALAVGAAGAAAEPAVRTVDAAGPGRPPASSSFTAPTITTTPQLTPRYRPWVADYVVACDPDVPVRTEVEAARGTWVSVDGRRWRTGTFAVSVRLAPGQRYLIRVAGGDRRETASVRCLPADFPTLSASGVAPDGWYLVGYPYLSGSPYVIVVDRYGTPVWWYRQPDPANPVDARFWTRRELDAFGWGDSAALSWANQRVYYLRRLDGTLLRRWGVGLDLDRHDLQPAGDGSVYTIRYVRRDCPAVPTECVDMTEYGGGAQDVVVDAEILQLDRSGRVLWTWRSRDHVTVDESSRLLNHPAEPLRGADGSWDLVHMNSVEPVAGGVVFSARHLDAVYKVSRASGAVLWKLGGTDRPESLEVLDGSASGLPTAMQHDARILSDGSLTVYDNGSTMSRPPRMVRYAIDVAAGTATEVRSLEDPRVANSGFAGSARPIAGGRWLMAWGGTNLVTVNRLDGTPVFTLASVLANGDKGVTYRAVPIPASRLSAGALRAGMDAMNPRA